MTYEYTLEVSQEFFDLSKIKANLPSFVEGLRSLFVKSNDANLRAQLGKVPSYNNIQRALSRLEYGEIKEQTVYVPPGLVCPYLELLQVMDKAIAINEGLMDNVLMPFNRWLAMGLADPDKLRSVRKGAGVDKFKPHNTERVLADLGQCFMTGSDVVKVPFKSAFLRNADVKPTYAKVDELVNRLIKIDRSKVMGVGKEIADKLEILIKRIEEDEDNYQMSPVSLQVLAQFAHTIARELEFYGVIVYQMTTLLVGIRNTTDAISEMK